VRLRGVPPALCTRPHARPPPPAEEHTPPPASTSARAEVGKAPRSSSGGAAARAPPPAPLFEDASPDAQAFLAAARARLQGLARPDGSAGRRGGSGGEPRAPAFELAMPPAPPPAPEATSRWAEQLEPSPEAAAAAAAAARRRGAPAARPVLLSYTPSPGGRAGVAPAPLAPTPRLLGALSPTPTPTASLSPFDGAPGSARRRSARGGAPVEMQTQTTPALAAAARGRGGEVQDMACGTTPQASVAPKEQATGGDCGADDWAGDDGAAGWGCDADDGCEDAAPAAPAAVSRSKRTTGPPGTPNKRLKAAFRGRKSLAWAGMQLEEGSGVRRSTRAHLRPLEYWRNETKAYGRQHQSLPTVASVTLRSPEPQWPAPAGWKPPRGGKPDGKHPARKAKTQARTRRTQDSEEERSDSD